jgi:rhodanese-related sulfurtransferase
MLGVILAGAMAMTGCQSMDQHRGRDGGKCKTCGMKAMKTCPQCGMRKGHCKCPPASPLAEINTSALKALIASGVKLTLVDARVGKYDDGRRIPNAINLGPEATVSEIESVLPSKEALIVTYCASLKCPAGRILATRLSALGYKLVMEYPEGIEGWVAQGNLVTQNSNKHR